MTHAAAAELLAGIDPSSHHEVALHLATHGYWTQYCSDYVAAGCLQHTDLIEDYLERNGYGGDVVVHFTPEIAHYGGVEALVDMSRFASVEEIEFVIAEHLVTKHPKPFTE